MPDRYTLLKAIGVLCFSLCESCVFNMLCIKVFLHLFSLLFFQTSDAKVEKMETPEPKKHKKSDSGQPPGKAAAHAAAKLAAKRVRMKKMHVKVEQRHRSVLASSEGKEKKGEGHKSGGQQRCGSKGDGSEAAGKAPERVGDKGKGAGSNSHAEDATPPAVKPPKHKHRKSEEVIIDPSVTDLFKPDGVIPTEHAKKEVETSELATKESKDSAPVGGGVKQDAHNSRNAVGGGIKQDAHNSRNAVGEMPRGRSQSVEGKNGVGGTGTLPKRALSVEGPKNWGDAGPDKKGDHAHPVSHVKQPAAPQLAKPAASGTEQKAAAEEKQSGQTAAASSNKETPQPVVYVSVKAEKGQVKVVHTKQMQSHELSLEKGGQNSGHSQLKKELKASLSQGVQAKKTEGAQHVEEQTPSHSQHKEEPKVSSSQPKEERKSIFELLAKPEVAEERAKDSAAGAQHKKERKESAEKKHTKTHREKRGSKDGECQSFYACETGT